MTETDQVLGEIRKLSNRFEELSLQIRIDTPWTRAKTHLRYALNFVREVPLLCRVCLLVAGLLATVAICVTLPTEQRKKLLMLSVNMVQLAIVTVNYG